MVLLLILVALALERLLDHLDEFAESAEEGAEAEAPALDADGVDEEVDLMWKLAWLSFCVQVSGKRHTSM